MECGIVGAKNLLPDFMCHSNQIRQPAEKEDKDEESHLKYWHIQRHPHPIIQNKKEKPDYSN